MRRLIIVILALCASYVSAQEVTDSVQIYFPVGKSHLDASWQGNQGALDRIVNSLNVRCSDSIFRLQRVMIIGSASPEGSISQNKRLSEERAITLFNYLSQHQAFPDFLKTTNFIGRDWEGLLALAEKDSKLPYRQETTEMLRSIVRESPEGTAIHPDPLTSIQRLRGGVPYRYMYRHFFPLLRYTRLYLYYKKVQYPEVPVGLPVPAVVLQKPDTVSVSQAEADTTYTVAPSARKPFYMAVKTNMLYDALLVPNVGVEFYLGKDWSVSANWMYAWWHNDRRHDYWRVYGGDISLHKWFGRAAERRPLTGHHIGIYAQALTYDFELGGKGIMGGAPGGTIFDKLNYGVGVEYGYSLPIVRKLNLDFTIGVGYLGGQYHEYTPEDNCYVWQATKQRHWFGPTKAEVSLVWLLGGKGNYNEKKGGNR